MAADLETAMMALHDDLAQDFFRARIFWDNKRPITKAILQSLDLTALERALLAGSAPLTAPDEPRRTPTSRPSRRRRD